MNDLGPRSMSQRGQEELDALRNGLDDIARALQAYVQEPDRLARAVNAVTREMHQVLNGLQSDLKNQIDEAAELDGLYEISWAIGSSLDLTEVLNRVMDQIIRLTGAERAFLMLVDESGALVFRAARNMDRQTIDDSSFEISRSVVYQVASSGEPIVTTNAQMDPRFMTQESVVSYNLRSILCVPLRARGQTIGVVYADNRIRAGLFSDRDRDLLAAFSNQAAIAIDNARLFQRVADAKALMDNIFASITSGVITTDIADQITLFNRAAERILGLASQQTVGQHYCQAMQGIDSLLLPLVEQVKRTQNPLAAREIVCELPVRGEATLRVSLSPLRDTNDATQGVAIVVDDLTEQRRLEAQERFIRETFQRYVAPAVVQQLLEDPSRVKLGGQRQEVTTLFADIRGFTAFSEMRDPERLVEVLNCYLAVGAEAALEEEGTLDKFIGDAVMAIFNAPLPQPDHTLRAVRAALRLRKGIAALHQHMPPELHLSFGAAINTGEAIVGNVGLAELMNYTAIGASVNLAKRMQERAAAGQILLSEDAYQRVREQVDVRALPAMEFKGLSTPEVVYELLDLKS